MVMGMVLFWLDKDLMDWIRIGEATGTPWKEEVLTLVERDEDKVVVMDAIVKT